VLWGAETYARRVRHEGWLWANAREIRASARCVGVHMKWKLAWTQNMGSDVRGEDSHEAWMGETRDVRRSLSKCEETANANKQGASRGDRTKSKYARWILISVLLCSWSKWGKKSTRNQKMYVEYM
jgi:hypothetical protein